MYLVKILQGKGKRVAILSRGYKRYSKGTLVVCDGKTIQASLDLSGDEPYMMARKLKDTPVVVDDNRYRGGQLICNTFHPDVIILDDAFQHRSVFREVDIVLLNSNNRHPRMLPYGMLREPLRNIRRAHAVIFTKSNLVPPDNNLVNALLQICRFTFKSELLPENEVTSINGNNQALREIKGPVVAVSGVGDPDSFEVIMEEAGLDYVHHFRHDDHAEYSETDLEVIREVFLSADAQAIITTDKDLAKLDGLKDLPVFALPVQIHLQKEDLEKIVDLIVQ